VRRRGARGRARPDPEPGEGRQCGHAHDRDDGARAQSIEVGDRSLFGASKIGAHWIAQRGKFMVSLTLAGDIGNGAQYRESMRKLAAAAVTRL
jgi:hypothetical protein